ncbi:MAG: shikimate kinase [Gemmatimonadota bacterium]
MKRHILLVGLPGSGKTTVGRMVAEQVGSSFIDPDNMIVRRMQMPIARIFGEFGEPRFRQLEQEVMTSALSGPPSVIAPGSGWAAQPGAIEGARQTAFIIYMRTLAMTAAKRAGGEGTRPLLVGEDPSEKMRQLLKEREAFFLQAEAEVKADVKTAPQVAEEILALAKAHGGW